MPTTCTLSQRFGRSQTRSKCCSEAIFLLIRAKLRPLILVEKVKPLARVYKGQARNSRPRNGDDHP